jgi:hypothetical protein
MTTTELRELLDRVRKQIRMCNYALPDDVCRCPRCEVVRDISAALARPDAEPAAVPSEEEAEEEARQILERARVANLKHPIERRALAEAVDEFRQSLRQESTRWFRWRCVGLDCSHEFDARVADFPGCDWCGNKTGRLLSIRVGYYGDEVVPFEDAKP